MTTTLQDTYPPGAATPGASQRMPETAGHWRGPRWLLLAASMAVLGACTHVPVPDRTGAGASTAAPQRDGVPAGIVSVTYADPAQFSEARESPRETDKARHAWLDALCLHLSDRAAMLLPEGQRLEVHLTDIQRAGGFEPWRGPQAGEVRIVRDIYPPRIDLRFKLLGADGSVLREGTRQLRDNTFLMRPNPYSNDPLRYEKTLVDDWLRQELGRKG